MNFDYHHRQTSGKRNDAYYDALARGEVYALLQRHHSQDVADFYNVSQSTVQRDNKGYTDRGKKRTNLSTLGRDLAMRKFVMSSVWSIEASRSAFNFEAVE